MMSALEDRAQTAKGSLNWTPRYLNWETIGMQRSPPSCGMRRRGPSLPFRMNFRRIEGLRVPRSAKTAFDLASLTAIPKDCRTLKRTAIQLSSCSSS